MVFTHIPSSLCLILAALAPDAPVALGLLLVRAALSQMDVPTRSSYVMAVVTPPERPAAASFTSVPRSLAASLSPALAGVMLAGTQRLAARRLRCAQDRLRPRAALFIPPRQAARGRASVLARLGRPRLDQRAQRHQRRRVGDAVDARLAEMTLEGGDDVACRLVVMAGLVDAVAVGLSGAAAAAPPLRCCSRSSASCRHVQRRRAHPVADAEVAEQFPGEFLARVLLARRRDVGMREHALGAIGSCRLEDRLAQRDDRRGLPQREVRIAEFVAGIDDLDRRPSAS